MISDATIRIASEVLQDFAPPPDISPSEWSEQSVYIPVGNAVPGLIRFDNAPYQREPLDMTANPECSRISLMWGAQVGKTMLALCAQAYSIVQAPKSQIMMQPSQGDLHTWLETKFNPMVEANDDLKDRIAKPRGRDGVNNQSMKSYPGGFLMFSWSGSPKTMRGRSAPFIVCDETDGYDRTHEGHPVGLLWQRAATFGDQRKLIEISTPTLKGASWIETAFDQGDQRRFHVPCPKCGQFQPLSWNNVKWDKDDAGEHLTDTAIYRCDAHDPETGEVTCSAAWTDPERISAIRQGRWVAAKPFRGHASYHLNELYSCFRRLSDVVQSFLEKKQAGDLQTFVNVSLAETWEETGDAKTTDATTLMSRREVYPASLPRGVGLLTAGVDTQDNRLECEIVGWGLDEESWGIDYKIFVGDPAQQEVWDQLDEYLQTRWTREDGRSLIVEAAAVDTQGHHSQSAYAFCRRLIGRRVWAIRGKSETSGRRSPVWPRKPTMRNKGKVPLYEVGTQSAKDMIARRLSLTEPGPGYSHFPATYDQEFFTQLTAERPMLKMVSGQRFFVWENPPGKRNEALDCRVYAYAALCGLQAAGLQLNRRVLESSAHLPSSHPPPAVVPVTSPPQAASPEKPSRLEKTSSAATVETREPPRPAKPVRARENRGGDWLNGRGRGAGW
jgi:phage terminase large subunit GpA-like protein